MPGRHLRRPRRRWLQRAAAVVAALLLGAAVGAAGWLVFEGGDDAPTAAGTAALEPSGGPIRLALAGELQAGPALTARLGGSEVVGFGEELRDADVSVVDLSAAVAGEAPPGADPSSWVPTSALDALEAAGVDVVTLANDRSLDLGPDGLTPTLAAGVDRRLDLVGIGRDEDEAYAPAVRRVGGVSVAVIGATQQLAPERIATDTAGPGTPGVASAKRVDRLVAEVEAASAAAGVVVVFLHWGETGQPCPSAGQQELAEALVAAGADVVAGTGTGTVQGAGRLGDAVVAYGLGALVADGATEGAVLTVEVDGGAVTGWELVPGTVVDGAAQPAPDAIPDLAARLECAALTP